MELKHKSAITDHSKWTEFGYHTYYKPTKERVYKVEGHHYWDIFESQIMSLEHISYDINTFVVTTHNNEYKVPVDKAEEYLVRFEIGSPAEDILYADTK